jgi:hypothetical protein
MRFLIRRGIWSPLLALFGATEHRAYVDVEPGELTLCFGSHVLRVPPSEVIDARHATWPWWNGVGWRVAKSSFGLIGALDGVVRLTLAQPQITKVVGLSYTYDKVFVSLEDPRAFLEALHELRAGRHGAPDGADVQRAAAN